MLSSRGTVQTGDWVRMPSLFPGIWRVSKTLAGFKENRWSLGEPSIKSSRTLVFCYRIVNDSWKRAFSHQSCEASFVQPLALDELQRLQALILSGKELTKAFERYQIKNPKIDLIANLSLGGLSDQSVDRFPNLCNEMLADRIKAGVTLDEVLMLLQTRGLNAHIHMIPRRVTLQLVSIGHELRKDEFVYRRYRVLSR
jgi:hypothetical protein